MKSFKKFAAAAIVALSLSETAGAGVIYDETVSGDLASFASTTFNLEKGVNSILGTSGVFTGFDSYGISLAAGLTLGSVEFFVSNVITNADTIGLYSVYHLIDADNSQLLEIIQLEMMGAQTTTNLFTNLLPFEGSRNFTLFNINIGSVSWTGDLAGTWDYEFRYTVLDASIPEPAALWLLGLGLLGLSAARRHKGTE